MTADVLCLWASFVEFFLVKKEQTLDSGIAFVWKRNNFIRQNDTCQELFWRGKEGTGKRLVAPFFVGKKKRLDGERKGA